MPSPRFCFAHVAPVLRPQLSSTSLDQCTLRARKPPDCCRRRPRCLRGPRSPTTCLADDVPEWKKLYIDRDLAATEKLAQLEQELDAAWYADDYERMSELRVAIDNLQSSSSVDILTANLKFYAAFSQGSVVDVASCWLQDKEVACKHPWGPIFVGFWDVIGSFESLFHDSVVDIRPDNVRISMRGSVALVTCEEHIMLPDERETPELGAATKYNSNFSPGPAKISMSAINIYEKRSGVYLLCYHSSSPRSE